MPPPTPLDLLPSTRRLLLLGIKERGEATAEQLSRASYLSIAAVRMHLYALEADGFVKHTRRRDGPGRPTHVYRLTPLGEELFPQGYAGISVALLAAIDAHPECKPRVFDILAAQQEEQARADVTASTVEGRIAEVAAGKEREGFFPKCEAVAEDEWLIVLRHCPIIRVVRDHPEFCEVERRAILAGTGASLVEVVGSRARGALHCSFRVRTEATPRESGAEAAGG